MHNLYSSNRKRRINKNGEEVRKNISYLLQFIDSARFMAIFLKEFIELNVNSDTMIKNMKHVKLNKKLLKVIKESLMEN